MEELSVGVYTHGIDYQTKAKTFHIKLSSIAVDNWDKQTKEPPIELINLTTRNNLVIVFKFDHIRMFKPLHKITGWMFISVDGNSYRLFVDKE